MNTNTKVICWGTIAAVIFFGATSYAEDPIADQELLDMVQSVDQVATENTVDILSSAETDDISTSSVAASNQVDGVDDLNIVNIDEDVASSVGTLISVRLNKVSLEDAINLFAQLSGANIVVPELTEAAQISVNLKDVEWRPALQTILDTYNYELYQRVAGSNVYSVRRRPAGAPEPQVVETFTLKYATVPNAAKLISALLPADAKVSEFASRNMIVVKSSESSLGEIRAVLDTIDLVRQQVFIESKFMELTDDAQKDLGIDWQALSAYEVGAQANVLSYGNESFAGLPSANLFKDLTGGSAAAAGEGEYAILTSVLEADTFNVVLSALENNRGVNVVSNPKIIVANEEMANISIVRKEPNLKQERQQSSGGDGVLDNTTFELDPEMPYFEYGIKLDVLPSVNTSSNITVQINPSLTRKFADKIAGENSYPVIDEKSINTIFSLASGQTAAIGGLTEVTESEEETKVPLLGSIPFLGRLFSWKQTVRGQTETIIFVTVGLANTQDITSETGMPEDSELARRRLILDKKGRVMRDASRDIYELHEQEKLDDQLNKMHSKEEVRLDRRTLELEKKRKKEARQNDEVALISNESSTDS